MKYIGYTIVWLIIAVALGLFMSLWASHFLGVTSPGLLLAITFAPVLPCYWLIPASLKSGTRHLTPNTWYRGFGLGLALIFLIAGITDLLGLSTINPLILFTPVGLGLLLGRIIQAGAEELIFRQFLFKNLTSRYPANIPFHHIGMVGAVFVLAHVVNPGFSLHSAVTMFIFSGLMCKQFNTNGLGWVWGFHTAWNWGLLVVVDSGAVFWLLQTAALLGWYQYQSGLVFSWKTNLLGGKTNA